MSLINIVAVLITLSAIFSYFNHRYLRLPMTIGLMLIALMVSLAIVVLSWFGIPLDRDAERLIASVNFNEALMHGMLSFLLFAGALHVDLNDLIKQKWVIATLATFGVVVSTFIVGSLAWFALSWLGYQLPFIYCLLFGALISPTDPIAVLGILKSAKAPKELEVQITGESLFNDGVGVVVFIVLLGIATGAAELTVSHVLLLFLEEAVGGTIFGLIIGYITYRMLKSVDSYDVEILLTLALVAGGSALASAIHVSGPIAIVVAGLLIGNHGRSFAMSDKTREHLDTFWKLIDEILNAVLFVLIGLEVLVLTFAPNYIIAGLMIVPAVLLARLISVALPIAILKRFRDFTPNVIKIMTWGGLRGGISIALALSLPDAAAREVLLVITYQVVAFSILVQGLTIGPMVKGEPLLRRRRPA